ncbi:MAG: mitochondrial fission ELM1 family protein, partial [Deltaproteobacteria bacterium]|nr:mitochondrial fission ELM1 family protein [Deltaproteobacteria bacterium]
RSVTSAPRVWLLMGNRAGDNSQVLGLGEALGWPLEEKHFVYRGFEKIVNLPFGGHLLGIDRAASSPLESPWPDVVISAGRKNEPIARYIKRRAAREHPERPPVRLIHVGRPWAALETWDLVVTTPQYRLPALHNVVHNETPLHRVTRERLEDAARGWRDRAADLPRPLIAVLAGGNSGPYPFDRASGERLACQADALARELGGSLLVTTSARTLDETTDALFGGISSPNILYRWKKDDPDNPFFAFLGLADRVIVTADSVSMMTEACATGRPVYLYDTGEGRTSMKENPWLDGLAANEDDAGFKLSRWHLKAWIYRLTMRLGPQRLTRDIRIVQQLLVESGRAVWLGDGHPAAEPPPLEDLPRAVRRVRALIEPPPDSKPSDPQRETPQPPTAHARKRGDLAAPATRS